MQKISELKDTLEKLQELLRRRPSSVLETGVLADDPTYGRETQLLEHIQRDLSIAIRNIQRRSKSNDPKMKELREFARKLQEELSESYKRSNEISVSELLAASCEKIHEYHEITEVPPDYGYHKAAQEGFSGFDAVQGFIALFGLINLVVNKRKKKKHNAKS